VKPAEGREFFDRCPNCKTIHVPLIQSANWNWVGVHGPGTEEEEKEGQEGGRILRPPVGMSISDLKKQTDALKKGLTPEQIAEIRKRNAGKLK
jgi:hypothetical protein